VSAAVDALGGLDVLVNAAGILRSSHTDQTTLDQFQQIIQVNLVGTFLMIREAIPALLEGTDSAVVNFSSTSVMLIPDPRHPLDPNERMPRSR
jgi:NAD(P)-dependent dehydrogenase (short-subunit alcohol dehydrogenase family)